jgi:hypothetical protein
METQCVGFQPSFSAWRSIGQATKVNTLPRSDQMDERISGHILLVWLHSTLMRAGAQSFTQASGKVMSFHLRVRLGKKIISLSPQLTLPTGSGMRKP